MHRLHLSRASLLLVTLAVIACGQESIPEASQEVSPATRKDEISQFTALILRSTVVGGEQSPEYRAAAEKMKLKVTLASDTEWAAMTAAQFASYRVIILGDANCATSLDAVSAALANRHVWGPVVNGNVLIAGTAPVANGAAAVTEKAIKFAAELPGLTGLYMSLSCYYQNAQPNTHVELLEPFGEFSVQSGQCHNQARIVAEHPELNDVLNDENMSNWPCSVNAQFDNFPMANFAPWSVAAYPEGARGSGAVREFYNDILGAPYILARGVNLNGCGDYNQDVGEECDYGYEGNGARGSECSSTCQLNWCGNGVVDEGEDCDWGSTSAQSCPRSCRIGRPPAPPPPPANRPPVARCRPVALSAGPSCGGVGASINDGSFDPDNNLVGCVQSLTTFEVGSTQATLTCTDAAGLVASCSAPVNVRDDSAPTISCPAPSSFECGLAQAAVASAQADDNCVAPFVTHTMEGEEFTVGMPRTVSWLASDGTNEATCSTSITMVDTRAPSLSLRGAALQQLECGVGSYTEERALASDLCAGDLSDRVAISGAVNAAAVGTYSVNYSVADSAGLEASAVRTVKVVDTLAPSIALVGAQSMKLECGSSFTNPGATAVDACSGPLTGAISYSGAVNTAAVGTYEVTARVVDGAGLTASAVRSVQVSDTQAPSIALNGASLLNVECGVGTYNEAGASANDVCTGDVSNRVSISGTVNTAARGIYTKTYSVTDASGNRASAVRTVKVNDTLAPSIALVGAQSMKLECGVDSFVNPGATAVDACSGPLTGAISYSGAVNTAAVGTYNVSASVVDAVGLSATAVRSVEVADTKAPSITLNGASSMTLECGVGSYSEAGASASDVCTGNVSNRLNISGTVNTAARGIYTKTYSVTDASGNLASATRTVTVNDTLAPVVTLVGAASMSIPQGSAFVEPGSSATDACSGPLAVTKTGSVNTSVPGTYTLTYSAQDAVGLRASVSRTVTVQAPQSCNSISVKPSQEIWPPNHKMWSFNLSECAAVVNPCGAPVDINAVGTITSIYSDEVEDAQGNGDGNTDDDIVITGPSSFELRAERQGKGNGRVYGVNFRITDSSGAVQSATCKFVVPHDQSGRGAIDDGAAAGYTVTR
jgi:hypothetical protein